MQAILDEDIYNDTYGRYRMYEALKLKHENDPDFKLPSKRTIYRIMEALGISHRPKRKPNGITKADRLARKSDDKLKRNFYFDEPLTKCVLPETLTFHTSAAVLRIAYQACARKADIASQHWTAVCFTLSHS